MNRQSYQKKDIICIALISILTVIPLLSVRAQEEKPAKLHTPAEILKIMEDSKLTYEIGSDYTAPPPDSPAVLSNQMYLRENEDGGHTLLTFTLSDQAKPVYDQAEEAFRNSNFKEAITLYNQVLVLQPDYFHALTLVGDAYFALGQFDSARVYFSRSIDLNFADYYAHWFLADTYKKLNDLEKAAREVTTAHLLNVNHLNLRRALRYSRERIDRPWKEWTFSPMYTLSKDGNKVIIKTTAEWMGYALVKAVWAYEPGYAESMLGDQKDKQVIVWPEEKESIVAALANNDSLKQINDIIDKGFFTEFVLYEVAAREHPSVLVLLPREEFMRVVEYVNTFH